MSYFGIVFNNLIAHKNENIADFTYYLSHSYILYNASELLPILHFIRRNHFRSVGIIQRISKAVKRK